MDPATLALIAAGSSAGSNLMTGFMEASSARDANADNRHINEQNLRFNAEQSQINRDWQERMSSTAYQRQSADMKAAGINPMAAWGSGGASSPGGGAASTGSTHKSERVPAINIGGVVSSALDAMRTMAEANKISAEATLAKERKLDVSADVANKYWQGLTWKSQYEMNQATAKSTLAGTPGKQAISDMLRNQSTIENQNPKFWGYATSIGKRLAPIANSAANLLRLRRR